MMTEPTTQVEVSRNILQAELAGLPKYIGLPCAKCGNRWRYVKRRSRCTDCHVVRQQEWRHGERRRYRKLRAWLASGTAEVRWIAAQLVRIAEIEADDARGDTARLADRAEVRRGVWIDKFIDQLPEPQQTRETTHAAEN